MSAHADFPDLALWLALQRLPQAGARTRVELLEAFGSVEAIFAASEAPLRSILIDKHEAIAAIRRGADPAVGETVRNWLAQNPAHHVVTWADADYPALLREIPDPPVAFYAIGNRTLFARPQIAIVGSRNPTPAGLENARAFARALARAGLTVTSGMALGIDGAAHQGALDIGGATIAVCGTGLDRVYPAKHRDLAHTIADRGLLVSEFSLGTPPRPEHFPIRNRLISGLTLGTLVVEAALNSGSLITARLALEQGREVFAIPGSIHAPQSRGCHALIRQGAKLVETAEDVVEELGALAQFVRQTNMVSEPSIAIKLPREAKRLLDCLSHDPTTLDTLVERSGLAPNAISSILTTLELEGLISTMPGGRYQRMP